MNCIHVNVNGYTNLVKTCFPSVFVIADEMYHTIQRRMNVMVDRDGRCDLNFEFNQEDELFWRYMWEWYWI